MSLTEAVRTRDVAECGHYYQNRCTKPPPRPPTRRGRAHRGKPAKNATLSRLSGLRRPRPAAGR
eukprot:4324498-Prymnesium_polylepis.1